MAKPKSQIPALRTNPITLVCPMCSARPGKPCGTTSGLNLNLVHVARVKAGTKKMQQKVLNPHD